MYHGDEYFRFERACMAAACGALQGAVAAEPAWPHWTAIVRGGHGGRPAEVRMRQITLKGRGRSLHTYVKVLAPIAGVEIEVRPTDERVIGQSLLLDVRTGDPAFDDYFVIDGAPADAVRAIIDPATRACLVGLTAQCNPGWSTDKVTLSVAPTGVTLSYAGGLVDPRQVSSLLDTVSGLVSRVGPIVAAAFADAASAARCAAELQDLHARRRAKSNRGRLVLVLVLALVGVVVIGFGVLLASVIRFPG